MLAASELTGLSTLGALARDSIQVLFLYFAKLHMRINFAGSQYSTLTDEGKKSALTKWERRWNRYLETIVAEEGNGL